MITSFYTALLALLLILLIVNIARFRYGLKVGLGEGDGSAAHLTLKKAVRAHGNFIETVPLALLLMMGLEYLSIAPLYLHMFGSLLVLSRILHFYGLSKSDETSAGRMSGMIITMLLLLIGALTILTLFVKSWLG
jgi:uncharacterized membrane protein YecN with MAPEG domain